MKGESGRRRYEKYTEPLSKQGSENSLFDGCANILFETLLQKVQPRIASISVGDDLAVTLVGSTLQVVDKLSNDLYGYIISTHNPDVIDCINKGNAYHAVVLNLSGIVCKVKVERERL